MTDREKRNVVIGVFEEDDYWQVHCDLFGHFGFSCSFDTELIALAVADGIKNELGNFLGEWVSVRVETERKK